MKHEDVKEVFNRLFSNDELNIVRFELRRFDDGFVAAAIDKDGRQVGVFNPKTAELLAKEIAAEIDFYTK